jgi:hypothetical protein
MKLELTLNRIEEDRAIFLTKKNQIVTLPTDSLPGTTSRPGDKIYITLTDQEVNEIPPTAKDVLNELLSTD